MRNKQIYDSWNKIRPTEATHERIINGIHKRVHHGKGTAIKRPHWKTFVPVAASVVLVLFLAVTLTIFMGDYGGNIPRVIIPHDASDIPITDTEPPYMQGYINDTLPELSMPSRPNISASPTSLPGADQPVQPISPIAPTDILTLAEAIADPYFGRFIPGNVPSNLIFDHAWQLTNDEWNGITAFWQTGTHNIRWMISTTTDYDYERVVSVYDRERFDLSLYTIPWMDSVPTELMQYVMNPMFLANELSLDIVHARTVQGRAGTPGGEPNWQINFDVLFDGVVIRISTSGVSPEHVWEMLCTIFVLDYAQQN